MTMQLRLTQSALVAKEQEIMSLQLAVMRGRVASWQSGVQSVLESLSTKE